MAKHPAASASTVDPLKTIAKGLDAAFKGAKVGTWDAKTAAAKTPPAASRLLSRFVYTTAYTLSYGLVFPAAVIARSIPIENPLVHGLVENGAD
jgi:hypothetical protein